MERKIVTNQGLVTFYENFGWRTEKIDSANQNDGEQLTHTMVRKLETNILKEIAPLEQKAERLLKIDRFWSGNFNNYWFNNIILSVSTLIIFLLVGEQYDFFATSSFSFPFLRDLILWTIVAYFVLYMTFFGLKLLIKYRLKKKLLILLRRARSFIVSH